VPQVGDPIPFSVQLFDGDATKFVQALVKDESGTPLGFSPVTLLNVGDGRYEDNSQDFPAGENFVSVTYKIYSDALFTTPSPDHSDATDVFFLELPNTEILECLEQIKDTLQDIKDNGVFAMGASDFVVAVTDPDPVVITMDGPMNVESSLSAETEVTAEVIDETVKAVIESETTVAEIKCDD